MDNCLPKKTFLEHNLHYVFGIYSILLTLEDAVSQSAVPLICNPVTASKKKKIFFFFDFIGHWLQYTLQTSAIIIT